MILTGRIKPKPPPEPYYRAQWSEGESVGKLILYEEWGADGPGLLEELADRWARGLIKPWGGKIDIKRVGREDV